MWFGGLRHGFDIFLLERISFFMGGVTVGNGERVGFVISGVARVGSSSLVV